MDTIFGEQNHVSSCLINLVPIAKLKRTGKVELWLYFFFFIQTGAYARGNSKKATSTSAEQGCRQKMPCEEKAARKHRDNCK